MGVTFRRRISWPENDLLFPAELFNVTVPPGLCSMDVRVPNIVDINKMNQLSSGSQAIPPHQGAYPRPMDSSTPS